MKPISVVLQLFLILLLYFYSAIMALEIQHTNLIHIYMPQVQPLEDDEYLCTAVELNTTNSMYIRETRLKFSPGRAHHYLLYGCYAISEELLQMGYWHCNVRGKGNSCRGRKQIPIGLKENPAPHSNTVIFRYPHGVSYPVGSEYKINYIVLEIHYLKALPKGIADSSGVTFLASPNPSQFLCGSLVFARAGFQIPPRKEKYSLDMSCRVSTSHPLYPYASWVHTHDLGSVVSAYVIHSNTGNMSSRVEELTRWTHRWPQPLSLLHKKTIIHPGDIVAAKCTYNSTGRNEIVSWGRKQSEEMCNLFLSFYTSRNSSAEDLSFSCVNELSRDITKALPKYADTLPSRKQIGLPIKEKKEDIICTVYRMFNMSCAS